jgi:ubiquinone/menaquinone biosynthesis C-methylase UbiE
VPPVIVGPARYDEVAAWYDATLSGDSAFAAMPRETALRLLGRAAGRLLDVGCGGGSHTAAFAAAGWDTVGIDVSEEQLRLARERGCEAVLGRAESLPFDDASFEAVVSMWTHTDIDDWSRAVREIRRVLRPGGPFVYVGVHPCFVGPHATFVEGRGTPQLHHGYYRGTRRYHEAPGISPTGLRSRVGTLHRPLGDLLQSLLDAGLSPERCEEPGSRDYPTALALRCR